MSICNRRMKPITFDIFHFLGVVMTAALVANADCRGKRMEDSRDDTRALEAIPLSAWKALASKRIFFGHQSVGRNIIEGIEALQPLDLAARLNIRETKEAGDFIQPVFAHHPIGENGNPKSKIDEFKRILDSGIGEIADLAIFKFCYVDIGRDTDIASLLGHFNATMMGLTKRFPNLRLVVFTVPLTNNPSGIKPLIKRLLGLMPVPKADNKARNLFNRRLKELFKEVVFDLAGVEATESNGRRTSFSDGDGTFDLMNPRFTDDGGHLNAAGKGAVAIELLRYLSARPK